jgi:prealbumin domain-containing protein
VGQHKTCTVTNDDREFPLVTIITTLSGSGQTGSPIVVPIGSSVTDQATLIGITPTAGGTISYKVYSDPTCLTLVFDATPAPNSVTNGAAPASMAFIPGTAAVFYWQVVYSGDANNSAATSVCQEEELRVAETVLMVRKHVINDSGGGNATANSFQLQLNLNGGFAGYITGSETGAAVGLPRNSSYSIVEATDPAPDYAVSYSADCTGTLLLGQFKTCTVTNDDIAPARLLVQKHVINDSGGSDATRTASDFQLQLNLNGGFTGYITGSETGQLLELPRGASYEIIEATDPAPTYRVSYSAQCTAVIQPGDNNVCTVTNDDIAPARLTVKKHVINNGAGTAVAEDFQLQLNLNGGFAGYITGHEAGELLEIPRGASYEIGEVTSPANYAVSYESTCTGTLPAGANASCTVTNDDIP